MRKALRSSVSVFLCTMMLCGCGSAKDSDAYTLEEWFARIREDSGIAEGEDMSDVQALTAYGVLEGSPEYDPDDVLNREWAAYTMVHLLDVKAKEKEEIRDLEDSRFPREVSAAVNTDLMAVDVKHRFHPAAVMAKEEADALLKKTVEACDNPSFATVTETELDKESGVAEITPLSFDFSSGTAVLPPESHLEGVKAIAWTDGNGVQEIYEISNPVPKERGIEVQCTEPEDPSAYLEFIHVQGETELDFSEAEYIGPGEESLASCGQDGIQAVSLKKLKQKTFRIKGYQVVVKTSASGISVDITRDLPYGLNFDTALKLNGVKLDYRFYARKLDIRNAYFRVNMHTQESCKLKGGSYKKKYGDFSEVKSQDFLPSLKSFLKDKDDMKQTEFPIGTFRIPIAHVPALHALAELSVVVYASGKAEIVLSQDNTVGMDVRNGVFRPIHECDHKENNVIRADTALTARMSMALEILKQKLMDIALEGGAKAAIVTTVHLYNDDGEMKDQETNLPADAVDELASGNPNVMVCTDMRAYWLLNLILNSSSTLCGRAGLSRTIELLGEKNGSLIPGGSQHFENWKAVNHCTRKARKKKTRTEKVPESTQIRLSSYAIAVNIGESKKIEITGLPKNYAMSDLTFTSNNSEVASVAADGTVTGLQGGAAMITIKTSDDVCSVSCSILVKTNKV